MATVNEFGIQVMYALKCYKEHRYGSSSGFSSVSDIDVWSHGQQLFGIGWGGSRKTPVLSDRFDYCPTVAMCLGRLTKSGHVVKTPTQDGYSLWRLTHAGAALLKERGL